ncbi:MAG TPA: HD domain-containing phosphohydrolase [Sulfuricella sp.]|nr:HD domain-containing phosphohydrolase [Sulfuricella sp.]
MNNSNNDLLERLERLNAIGVALSAERDTNRTLEMILEAAKSLTNADGGTLYRVTDDNRLKFEILRNDTLNIAMGGTKGAPIPFDPLPLYDEQGNPNNSMVVAYSVLHDTTINIEDAYSAEGFDFSGTRNFDKKTGYRSKSFLTVPMKNHENEIIGVLQLINVKHGETGEIIPFSKSDQRLTESLASQAAIALTNRLLITQLEELFESFVRLINIAIDEKSPYTGGHCARVPVLTMLLAEAASAATEGPLKDFRLTDADRKELKIAALLHDCGKVTTPVHVVDKATKLQTIFDRIQLLDTRFELLKRDAEIEFLRSSLQAAKSGDMGSHSRLEAVFQQRLNQLDDDRAFLRKCNAGSEFMSPEDRQRVENIARYGWVDEKGEAAPFLSEDEEKNLKIAKGTLTDEERQVINYHIVATIKMLEALPWPKHLKRVPEYAGGHHERMDGKGYPKGLTREQMPIQARTMAIADIFEALTALDRPYKRGIPLAESLRILGLMKLDNHIDPDLFDIFIREKIYAKYAEQFLESAQIDEVDMTKIPGFSG